jgi:methyltransferase (TIGR00027 family)
MAAARARESGRPGRLFHDPLAAALAGPEGFAWLNRMERAVPWALLWGGPALYVVMRTRFFDEFLLRGSRSAGVRQVVLLAAGMDTRAFRLGWPPGMRLYELDRPEVLKAKEGVVARAGARPACERRVIGADLAYPSWSEALLEAGYEPEELSAWLAEDLLFYIPQAAVRGLLDGAGALATPGSLLGVDLVNEDLLASPLMQPLLRALARRGAPVHFGANDPEALLAEHGWEAEATQPGERGANYGRWPYPAAPRRVPGVPRLFFIRAQRRFESRRARPVQRGEKSARGVGDEMRRSGAAGPPA